MYCSNYNPDPPLAQLISRRGFLRAGVGVGALGATQAFGGAAFAESCAGTLGTVPPEQRSIQLFTLTGQMALAAGFTLQQLYGIGYRMVEHAGFGSAMTAEAFKQACDDAGPDGIWSSSGHQGIDSPYDEAAFAETMADSKTIGQRYIINPSGGNEGPGAAGWAAFAKTLNKAGAAAKAQGFKGVGHHNHNTEYTPFADDPTLRPIDVLVAETDPELVVMEMDIYWVWNAETDPVEFLEKYPGRYRQFHVKDMDGTTGQITFPGLGVIDFNRVFEVAAKYQQIEEYIIEQDTAGALAFQTAQLGWDLLEQAEFDCPAPAPDPSTSPSPAAPPVRPAPANPGATSGDGLPATGIGSGLGTLALAGIGAAVAMRRRRRTSDADEVA